MKEMEAPREVAKNFYFGTLLVCIIAYLLLGLRIIVGYDWSRLARASIEVPLALVICAPILFAAYGYLRQHRLVRWVATHIPPGSETAVASVGSAQGLRQFVHVCRPVLHIRTADSIVRVDAILNAVEFVNSRSLEVVQVFEVREAPTLTSIRIWGFMVRVRTHQAHGICVYRAESGTGIVAYIENEMILADATHNFWKTPETFVFWEVAPSVEEALAIAERAGVRPRDMNERTVDRSQP